MPKLGMEPIRREALVKATIAEIGVRGTLDVTVSQIARRAGMSSALAHHYFGSKEKILLAAMRYVMGVYAAEVRGALAMADTPEARVEAIVRASFSERNFRSETVAGWLNFYVLAQTSDEARRLLHVYHRRLHSNLCHALRPLVGARADEMADRIAALIDGVYLRQSLGRGQPDRDAAVAQLRRCVSLELKQGAT
ncbi:transcriptional regulator BetI [Rhodobacteraceae bacterium D3-12]|nr:transcriptional regulator BetI [Rhodobacteraceae bacterium D3-12]